MGDVVRPICHAVGKEAGKDVIEAVGLEAGVVWGDEGVEVGLMRYTFLGSSLTAVERSMPRIGFAKGKVWAECSSMKPESQPTSRI